jgi:hypothetical protein
MKRSRPMARRIFGMLAAFALAGVPAGNALAQENVLTISTSRTQLITVEKGKPKTIRTHNSFFEIVVGDPEIANVQPLTNRSFYVLGVNAGTTGIALFDEQKQLIGSIDVEVSVDTTRLKTAIRENVPDAKIKVTTTNGQVVLSGEAPDQVSADRARKIAEQVRRQRGRDHQLGERHVLAAGAAQCPLRRDQPQCRAGTRRQYQPGLQPRRNRQYGGGVASQTVGGVFSGATSSAGLSAAALMSTWRSRRWRIAAWPAVSPSRTSWRGPAKRRASSPAANIRSP